MAIPAHEELAGSPTIELAKEQGPGAERRFLVAWSNALAFADSIAMGYFPGMATAYVNTISIQPFTEEMAPLLGVMTDPSVTLASYGSKPAIVTVKYAADFYNVTWPTAITRPTYDADTSLRLRVRFSGQFLTMPSRAMRWYTNPYASPYSEVPGPDQNARILIPMAEYILEWDYVANPNITRIRGLIGKVNDAAFLGSNTETLMLESADLDHSFKISSSAPFCWKVTATFKERRIKSGASVYGWNHDYCDNPAGWKKIVMSDGNPRYETGDFSKIFQQA